MVDLLKYVDEIKKDCYFDRDQEVFSKIQSLSEQLIKYNVPLAILKMMAKAMEKKDVILIGDCLEYGINPYLNGNEININLFTEEIVDVPVVEEKYYYLGTYTQEPALCVKSVDNDNVVRLNSAFSPENEVEKWMEGVDIKKTTTVVCLFGLGTGLFAEKILEKLPPKGKLLIDEPNQDIIDYCIGCGSVDDCDEAEKLIKKRLTKIIEDERVVLLVETNKDLNHNTLFARALDSRDFIAMMGMIIVKHNGYERAFPKGYLNFLRAINDYRIKMYTNRNTARAFKETYMDNFMYNIYDYDKIFSCSDIESFLPKDIPVIIVAAGPSLKKNIEILRQAKGHCFIIAVDTAIRFMLKNNIIPDITITLDAEKPEECYSDELSHMIPCMFDVDSNPKIVHKHKGYKFLFNCRNSYAHLLCGLIKKTYYVLEGCGGSVATAAFAIMRNFGQKKIILIGQDLAYVDGMTHAGDVNDGSDNITAEVDGIDGGKVATRSDWFAYLKWFEKQIEEITQNKKDIEVIDATEGGALIHGSTVMTLQNAIDGCRDENGNLPDYNFEEIVKKSDYYMTEEEYRYVFSKHKDSIRKLKEIENKSDEAVKICRNILIGIEKGTVSSSYIDKEKKKINIINNYCRKSIIFPAINAYVVSDIVEDVGQLMLGEGDAKTIEKNRIKMLKLSFESIMDAAIRLQEKQKMIEKERSTR